MANENGMTFFKFFYSYASYFEMLSEEDTLTVFKKLIGLTDSEPSPAGQIVYKMIKDQNDRDEEAYQELKATRAEAGAKGGRPPKGSKEEKPKKKNGVEYTAEFERMWRIYPRRVDKGLAFKKWTARINAGCTPDELIHAAEGYAAACKQYKTEPRFIKHAATFYGDAEPFRDYLPQEEEKPPEDLRERALAGWPIHMDERMDLGLSGFDNDLMATALDNVPLKDWERKKLEAMA